MRDPNRIEGFMRRLTDVWKSFPDLRFGQLIEDILHHSNVSIEQLFYMEDEQFNLAIESFRRSLDTVQPRNQQRDKEILKHMIIGLCDK